MQSKAFFLGGEEPVYPAGEGVTRQFIGYDDSIMMLKVMFEKNAVGAPHTHPHAQTTYIVSGKFEFTIGDDTKILEPGDGFYAEPHILHGCKCLEKGVLIDVFSPMREDFLQSLPLR